MCFVVDEEIYDGDYCVMIILNLWRGEAEGKGKESWNLNWELLYPLHVIKV